MQASEQRRGGGEGRGPLLQPEAGAELGAPRRAEALGKGGAQQDTSRDHRLFRHPAPDAERHEEEDDQPQQNIEK